MEQFFIAKGSVLWQTRLSILQTPRINMARSFGCVSGAREKATISSKRAISPTPILISQPFAMYTISSHPNPYDRHPHAGWILLLALHFTTAVGFEGTLQLAMRKMHRSLLHCMLEGCIAGIRNEAFCKIPRPRAAERANPIQQVVSRSFY